MSYFCIEKNLYFFLKKQLKKIFQTALKKYIFGI